MVNWVTALECKESPSDFSRAAYMGFRGADCHVTKLVRSLSARISQTLLVFYLGQCPERYNYISALINAHSDKSFNES